MTLQNVHHVAHSARASIVKHPNLSRVRRHKLPTVGGRLVLISGLGHHVRDVRV